ncbi:hypothetical protein HYX18_01385 [Candidatus Woesearchaeota archaeon]|nr:hypothetical protein [Candidatus Woesearchaeota archaeon]
MFRILNKKYMSNVFEAFELSYGINPLKETEKRRGYSLNPFEFLIFYFTLYKVFSPEISLCFDVFRIGYEIQPRSKFERYLALPNKLFKNNQNPAILERLERVKLIMEDAYARGLEAKVREN